jgi:hypothetical protein
MEKGNCCNVIKEDMISQFSLSSASLGSSELTVGRGCMDRIMCTQVLCSIVAFGTLSLAHDQ